MGTSHDDLIAELDAVVAAKLRILKAGQSVTLPGASAQITPPAYAELCKRERELRSRLLRCGGATSKVRPNYSAATGVDWTE